MFKDFQSKNTFFDFLSSDGVDFIMERPEDDGIHDRVVVDNHPGDDISDYIYSSDEEDDYVEDSDLVFVPHVGFCNPLLLIEDGDRIIHQVLFPDEWEGEDDTGRVGRGGVLNWLVMTGRVRTGRARTRQERTGPVRSGLARVRQERSGRVRAGRARTGRMTAGRMWTSRVRAGRVRAVGPPVPVGAPVPVLAPPVAPPLAPPVAPLVASPAGPCPGPPGPPSTPQSPDGSPPSTSGPSSSSKRSREENSTEQVSMKRRRTSDGDSAPSTSSGLSSSTNSRFWHAPSHRTGWSDDSDSD